MKAIKYILLLIVIASLASCGIFKKDCGCPHFGKTNTKATSRAAHTI